MTAGIFSRHCKCRISLFCKTNLELNSLTSVIQYTAAAVYDQRIFGVDEVTMLAGQLLYGLLKRLFIPGKRND